MGRRSNEYLMNEVRTLDDMKDLTDEEFLIVAWGESGISVLEEIEKTNKLSMTFAEFLNEHCTACGGNWSGMLLTGIKKLFPDIYEAIPDDMGIFSFRALCTVLKLAAGVSFDGENG